MAPEDHAAAANPEHEPSDAAAGPEHSSGPAPHAEDLTVEDILNAAQSEAAQQAEAATDPSDAAAQAAETAAEAAGESEAPASDPLQDQANPYLEDLRRITAEYANYRKRTEANAELEKQRAKAAAVSPLLSVLDDLDRAESHGDLVEGSAFATIAQKIRTSLERMGLEGFGEKGEAFDPQLHEAIAQIPVPGTETSTVLDVVERGYRIGGVELRPAKVAVAVATDG